MRPDIIFYQQYAVPYFGILSLDSHLKQQGLHADVLIHTLEKDPIEALKKIKPGLVGISLMSPEHNWLIQTTAAIRKALPETRIIVGGIHSILYYQEILRDTCADMVCHSEGEKVLVQVIEELNKDVPQLENIPGLAYRDDAGNICINERAELVPFSDEIIEDRDIYFKRYPELIKDSTHRFFSSRGCPYRCSFCYNAVIHDTFKGKGRYVRQKSVDNFIQEILSQTKKYSFSSIYFYDDLFTYNEKWLLSFLERYGKEIKIPFMCTTRANVINETVAQALGEAGCRTVSFGIETGNYDLRSKVLNKYITDEQIVECGRLLKKYGMKIQTTNMFCLPDETLSDAYKTVEINHKAHSDYAFTALFMPFPNTALANYCIEKGYLKKDYSLRDMPYSFLTESVLSLPDKEKIINLHRLAYFFIRWSWLYKLFRRLPEWNALTPLYRLIFVMANFLRHKEERGISFWPAVRYAWRLRKSL